VPVRVEDCIVCRTCESQCPEGAIQVIEFEIEPARVEPPKVVETKKKPARKQKRRPLLKQHAPRRNRPTNAHATTDKVNGK